MIVRGVSFIDDEVVKWKRKTFIDAHKLVFFTELDMAERERILGKAWDEMKGVKKDKVD